jgi:hypothetical protein
VADQDNNDAHDIVLDVVHDAVVAHTKAVQTRVALQLLAPNRARVVCKAIETFFYAALDL